MFIHSYINQIFIEHLQCVVGVGDAEVNIFSSDGNGPLANRKMTQGYRNRQTDKQTFWIM